MRRVKIVGLIVLAAAAIAAGAGGSGPSERSTWQMPRVVRLQSGPAFSYFPGYIVWLSSAAESEPQGLLLRDGDLVGGDSISFVYRDADGVALTTHHRSGITSLGDVPVTMMLDEIGARGWLDRATSTQLAQLRLVVFPDSIPDGLWPAARRLAGVNPNVGMFLESSEHAPALLEIFKPTLLVMGERRSEPPPSLANQPQLETLIISAKDSGAFIGLGRLSHLRRLLLTDWNSKAAGPLPAGLTSLRALVIVGGPLDSTLAPLGNVTPQLEELTLLGATTYDLGGLRAFPDLRTLVLNRSTSLTDLAPLAALPKLQWLGFPPKTTQSQFDGIVTTHPALAIVDLTGVESVTDLSALKGLKDLQALILDKRGYDLRVLPELKSLRFVGVGMADKDSVETQRARARVAAIRKALPDALVVPVGPMCLGSGWILLLIPAAALSWYAASRSRRRTLATGTSG